MYTPPCDHSKYFLNVDDHGDPPSDWPPYPSVSSLDYRRVNEDLFSFVPEERGEATPKVKTMGRAGRAMLWTMYPRQSITVQTSQLDSHGDPTSHEPPFFLQLHHELGSKPWSGDEKIEGLTIRQQKSAIILPTQQRWPFSLFPWNRSSPGRASRLYDNQEGKVTEKAGDDEKRLFNLDGAQESPETFVARTRQYLPLLEVIQFDIKVFPGHERGKSYVNCYYYNKRHGRRPFHEHERPSCPPAPGCRRWWRASFDHTSILTLGKRSLSPFRVRGSHLPSDYISSRYDTRIVFTMRKDYYIRVYVVITSSRLDINGVWLPILLVVNWMEGKKNKCSVHQNDRSLAKDEGEDGRWT